MDGSQLGINLEEADLLDLYSSILDSYEKKIVFQGGKGQ